MRTMRFWFNLSEPVGRGAYARHGLGLMGFKYAVDAGMVWMLFGVAWPPWQYLSPFFMDRQELLSGPPLLAWGFVVWTLPFLWIGVALTLRRTLDAGISPWICLLFFVPLVNYMTMLTLCLVPGSSRDATASDVDVADGPARSALLGVAIGALIVLGTVLRVDLLGGYGSTVFLGAPFVVGAVTGYLHNDRGIKTLRETSLVVVLALLVGAGAVLLLALEGLVCLLMALPLAAPVALLGGLLGRVLAIHQAEPLRPGTAALVVLPLLLLPAVPGVERDPSLREVVTAIEIDASAAEVWSHVVGFSEVNAPPAVVFRLGIAYPVRAVIEGAGVGALRRCEFSTGAFVEPITAWEEGRRLAFDVIQQPPPLQEWSPYSGVHPPHLDGYFRTRRGEFRLTPLPGGRTRLEGSTFYEIEMYPQLYWRLWADAMKLSQP